MTGRLQPKTMMYIHFGFEIFLRLFNTCLDKHAPLKTIPKKEERVLQKPWITDGIKMLIKVRDQLYKQMIKQLKTTL